MTAQEFEGQEQRQDGQEQGGSQQSFSIPDEYAEKGWTKTAPKFANQEEYVNWITKQYDRQQEFLGGKLDKFATEKGFVSIPDWNNEEQVKNFFAKISPQDVSEYPTKEFESEEAKTYFNNAFKEAGLAVPQAKKIIEAFNNYQNKVLEQVTSKEDYNKRMEGLFGKDFEKAKEPIDNMLKGLLTAEEMQLINDYMPNQLVEVMYKISKGLADKYGHKEQPQGGSQANKDVMTKEEKATKHAEYTKQLNELTRRPHTLEEKQSIINKLVELYK